MAATPPPRLPRAVEDLVLSCGDGHEDVERSARFFRKDGLVIRYRFLCAARAETDGQY